MREPATMIATRFDRASQSYDAHADVQRIAARQIAAFARHYLPAGALLLDAGCGTGMLATLLHDYRFMQCDRAESMARRAYQRHSHHTTYVADITALPLFAQSVDGYVSSLCWQWVNPLHSAITEMKRVIKKDGFAVIAMLVEGTFCELSESFSQLALPQRMLQFKPAETVGNALLEAGMRVVKHEIHPYITHHASASAFFQHLKHIGATASGLPERPLKRAEIMQLMQYYEDYYSTKDGVSATYNTAYWVLAI